MNRNGSTVCETVLGLLDRMKADPYEVHDRLGFAAIGAEDALGMERGHPTREAFRQAKIDLLDRLYAYDLGIRSALQELADAFGCRVERT